MRIEFQNSYIDFETWNGWEFSWKAKERLIILFKALSFFENGSLTGINSEYDALMNRGKVSEEIMFSEWQAGSEKVFGIRFYKNRKMVIKFVSDEVAQDFFKTMCKSGL